MEAIDRLKVWLRHNGHEVLKRGGREFIRVERRQHGPMKIFLRLTASGWVAAGDRKSHRSRKIESLIRDFNDAERVVSGPDGDRMDQRVREKFADLPDYEVQSMADYYRAQGPLTLDDIGRETYFSHRSNKPFIAYRTLSSLVSMMRYRDAWLTEAAKRSEQ